MSDAVTGLIGKVFQSLIVLLSGTCRLQNELPECVEIYGHDVRELDGYWEGDANEVVLCLTKYCQIVNSSSVLEWLPLEFSIYLLSYICTKNIIVISKNKF